MTGFAHLQNAYRAGDERPYSHRVRIRSAPRGSVDAQHRYTFYPDNSLRWQGNEPVRADDGRTEYGFPDEAAARKFADRFDGQYVGLTAPDGIASKTE
jgi:hypothetical protein